MTASGKMTGGSWAADCKTSVSGQLVQDHGRRRQERLVAVRRSAVYAATGLFRVASTSGYKEGIDVSHWQGAIDWAKVKAAGKTFVFAKATEGNGFGRSL